MCPVQIFTENVNLISWVLHIFFNLNFIESALTFCFVFRIFFIYTLFLFRKISKDFRLSLSKNETNFYFRLSSFFVLFRFVSFPFQSLMVSVNVSGCVINTYVLLFLSISYTVEIYFGVQFFSCKLFNFLKFIW